MPFTPKPDLRDPHLGAAVGQTLPLARLPECLLLPVDQQRDAFKTSLHLAEET